MNQWMISNNSVYVTCCSSRKLMINKVFLFSRFSKCESIVTAKPHKQK